jgi:hypothetical protein
MLSPTTHDFTFIGIVLKSQLDGSRVSCGMIGLGIALDRWPKWNKNAELCDNFEYREGCLTGRHQRT